MMRILYSTDAAKAEIARYEEMCENSWTGKKGGHAKGLRYDFRHSLNSQNMLIHRTSISPESYSTIPLCFVTVSDHVLAM